MRLMNARVDETLMKAVLINADDLGYSSVVNDSIFDLIERGLVTSPTLMANAPAIEEASRRLCQYPQASFGIHLNLTEFPPLTKNTALTPLLDSDGCMHSGAIALRLTSLTLAAMEAELTAQVQRVINLGVSVSHFDSHHHCHTRPQIFPILKRLQKRFGVRRVRLSRNVFDVNEIVSPLLRAKKAMWNAALRHCSPTRTTDGFLSFQSFHEHLCQGTLSKGVVELMCHPGNSLFQEENRLLTGDWIQRLPPGIRLISYNDV